MRDLVFWGDWPRPHRIILIALLALFAGSTIYHCIVILKGETNALEWLITSTMETIQVPVKTISVGLFEFELSVDNYLINQYYQGSAHQVTPVSGYLFLASFTMCLVMLLTICSHLKRFWYLIGMTGLCFVFVSFRFEQLEIFGWIDNTFLIIVLGLIFPVSYYFQSFNQEVAFIYRFLAFFTIISLLAVFIFFFSEKNLPFYFLINYGHVAPVVISILFIAIVSHEIIYFILFAVSGSQLSAGKSNTTHFIALSLAYLTNVVLLYLKNALIIDWNIVYINAFFLLLISAVIGIWGFKQREILYQHLFPFKPFGAYLFLTLALICLSTISYHTVTANDPVLETFEDAIVFTHIGFGLMFFLYILSNFINLIGKGLAVYKVAYKEDNMPYFSANIAGLVIAAAFYYLANQAPLNQAFAGYYNGLGSVYMHEGDHFLAEQYYKRGDVFAYNNHRSNYSIGEIALLQNNQEKAIKWFKNASVRNPSEFSIINQANAQKAEFLFFDGLFTLKEGVKKFPNSVEINNNLGLLFRNTNILDSAIYYMERGAHGLWGNKTNQTNIIDVLARNKVLLPADSLIEIYQESNHLPIKANLIAYSNNSGNWLQDPIAPNASDSILDLHQLAYFNNYYVSRIQSPSTDDINMIKSYANHPANSNFRSQLVLLQGMLSYGLGQYSDAFRTIEPLSNDPLKKGYYNHILGVMAMELRAPRLAADFFQQAVSAGHESAPANLAIALTEADSRAAAIGSWNQLLTSDSLDVANDVLVALSAPSAVITSSNSDALKYQAIRYRTDFTSETRQEIFASIINDQFKIASLISTIEKSISLGQYRQAGENITLLKSYANQYEIENALISLEEDLKRARLADSFLTIDDLVPADPIRQNWEAFDQQVSQEFFRNQGYNNPFDEASVIIASDFFRGQVNDRETAYDILVKAIEVNPYSSKLIKSYILEAINNGLETYADEEMEKLRSLISHTEFRTFEIAVQEAKQQFNSYTFPTEGS